MKVSLDIVEPRICSKAEQKCKHHSKFRPLVALSFDVLQFVEHQTCLGSWAKLPEIKMYAHNLDELRPDGPSPVKMPPMIFLI